MQTLRILWADAESKRTLIAAACAALTLCMLLLTVTLVNKSFQHQRRQQVNENLHAIQLAVERFAVDSLGNLYPHSIEQVIEAGYIIELPVNPFTGQPMRCVESEEQASPGDFSYFPKGPQGQPATLESDISMYRLQAYY